nr:glycosyltransferase [Microbacterium sp. Marseille-Q6648]
MPDRRLKARISDAVATRSVLRHSRRVLVLTDAESVGVRAVARSAATHIQLIANGIAVRPREVTRRGGGRPVVLFLARLHPRKGALTFAAASKILVEAGCDADFRVVGPDEGDLQALVQFKQRHSLDALHYCGAIGPGDSLDELRTATVYVLPSRQEVFPMTVLEALSVGTPVVLSDECGIAKGLETRSAAIVCRPEERAVANAIDLLLSNHQLREALIRAGYQAIDGWLSIEAVVKDLEHAYGHTPA